MASGQFRSISTLIIPFQPNLITALSLDDCILSYQCSGRVSVKALNLKFKGLGSDDRVFRVMSIRMNYIIVLSC